MSTSKVIDLFALESAENTFMRARIDNDDGHSSWEIAEKAYNDKFLSALGSEFKFTALDPKLAYELRRIADNYILERRFGDLHELPATARKTYQDFLKVTEAFLNWLKKSYDHPHFYNIATEILMTARGRREPETQTDFPGLTEHQKRVESHYRELLRLAVLLRATLIRRIKSLKRSPGPKPDTALRHFILGCSEFWTHQLGRKFTIDYHKGAGLTDAFKFCRALLQPLERVREKDVVTAMRAEKSLSRKSEMRARSKRT
ncbi:MAG: hypothetical protein KGJ66_09525 [Alphaproteobacteria bacterium]|nr:hypothetical protein [Alphaproteobacteria bacterium]